MTKKLVRVIMISHCPLPVDYIISSTTISHVKEYSARDRQVAKERDRHDYGHPESLDNFAS
jgi:hypothetical protein